MTFRNLLNTKHYHVSYWMCDYEYSIIPVLQVYRWVNRFNISKENTLLLCPLFTSVLWKHGVELVRITTYFKRKWYTFDIITFFPKTSIATADLVSKHKDTYISDTANFRSIGESAGRVIYFSQSKSTSGVTVRLNSSWQNATEQTTNDVTEKSNLQSSGVFININIFVNCSLNCDLSLSVLVI